MVRFSLVPAYICALVALSSPSFAAPIFYGDFVGSTVQFFGVTEDSGTDATPLFGAPVVAGDTLDFNPKSFNSFSTGAAGNDITDGTLTFFVQSLPGFSIKTLKLSEQGDVTLSGFGNNKTFAAAYASIFVDILAIDGNLIDPISLFGSMVVTPSGGTFELLADGGGGPLYKTIWTGSKTFDIAAAIASLPIVPELGVTAISVTLDNTLVTLSQEGTSAFIAKKDAKGVSISVPEVSPLTMIALAALVTVVMTRIRFKRVAA
jgi:hypothetical protein